jgi:hypothetical protein
MQTMSSTSMITKYYADNSFNVITILAMRDTRTVPSPPPIESTPDASIREADRVLIGLVAAGVALVVIVLSVILYLVLRRREYPINAHHGGWQQPVHNLYGSRRDDYGTSPLLPFVVGPNPPGSAGVPGQTMHRQISGTYYSDQMRGGNMNHGSGGGHMGALFTNAGLHIVPGLAAADSRRRMVTSMSVHVRDKLM